VPTAWHPTAKGTATPESGPAPRTASLDASASKDNEEGRIVRYRWNFTDGPDPVGPEAFDETATYTFQRPGRYKVALTVSNEKGVPSTLSVPVLVHPPAGDCVLSVWAKDSYYGACFTPIGWPFRSSDCRVVTRPPGPLPFSC